MEAEKIEPTNIIKLENETDNSEQEEYMTSENEPLMLAEQQGWKAYIYKVIASYISTFSRYYDRVIQVHPRDTDKKVLFEAIDAPEKIIVDQGKEVPDLSLERNKRTLLLYNGNFNHDLDIQESLTNIKKGMARSSRLAIVLYNPYFRWLYSLANLLKLREGEQPSTFLTRSDIENLCELSGFQLLKLRPMAHIPFELKGFGTFLNRILPAIPFLKWFSLTCVAVLRPIKTDAHPPSVTILIPARNEKGNIEDALKRIPELGTSNIEVIYVEGHSKDGTWEEIQRVIPLYNHKFKIRAFQQTGKGKADAVRLGFEQAENELLMILDADLTMPPEMLPRFVHAYNQGLGDFINGHRLLYPMESKAMRFLNWLGNLFFAKSLSIVLDARLGDSLCGTKVVAKHDYDRMIAWRKDFDDFDPFGDFELLFPASILGLGIVNIPIRYRDRVYGATQISRFYHGAMLLKMTLIGLLRVKIGPKVS